MTRHCKQTLARLVSIIMAAAMLLSMSSVAFGITVNGGTLTGEPQTSTVGDSAVGQPSDTAHDSGAGQGGASSGPDGSADQIPEQDSGSLDAAPETKDDGAESDPPQNTVDQAAEDKAAQDFDEFIAWLNTIPITYRDNASKDSSRPFLRFSRAGEGDTGFVSGTSIPVNTYHVTVNGVSAWGEEVARMEIGGQNTFCVEMWKFYGSGQYTAKVDYDGLSQSQQKRIAQTIANYNASGGTDADYIAAQVIIWEICYGRSTGGASDLYARMISGTEADPYTDKDGFLNPADKNRISNASARINAYDRILNGTETGEGLLFWYSGSAQVITTLIDDFDPDIPDIPDIPDVPDEDTEKRDAYGQVTIVKKNQDGASLDGAIFDIAIQFANGSTGGNSHFEVHDGSNTFYYNHPEGDTSPATITITEIQPPEGYVADPTPQTVVVAPTYTVVTTMADKVEAEISGSVSGDGISGSISGSASSTNEVVVDAHVVVGDRPVVTFVNEEAEAKLVIYKYQKGDSSIPLSGAQFNVSYVDPSICSDRWSVTTGADGKVTISLPRAGAILIEETKAPENYVIVQPHTTVTIARGETKQVDIPNDKKGSLIIVKRDVDDGRLLPGTTFAVTNIGTGHTQSVTTGADGTVRIDGLDPGDYRVEETNPPQYYVLSKNPIQTVKILDGSTETVSLEFFNEAYTGLKIIKVDAQDGKGLAGAVFSLFRGEQMKDGYPTGERIGDYTTSPNGSIIVENLSPGKYTIYEEQPPHGYVLDEKRWQTVTVTDDNIDDTIQVIFRNEPKPKLRILKRDKETHAPLEGAVFRVALKDSPVYNEYSTDANGEIFLENMEADWYIVTEIRAPSGYLLPDPAALAPVQLVPGKTTELVVSNQMKPTLTIEKVDAITRSPLPNAVFKLTKRGASEYTYITTGPDGKAVVSGLEAGWFIVEEITAPTGYQLVEDPFHIELKPDENAVITIENTKKPTLLVKKVDKLTRNPLANAKFELRKADGTIVASGITDSNGEFFLNNLEPGTYRLKETAAPDGYEPVVVEQDVVIRDGMDVVVTVENSAKEPLYIQKIDSKTGQPLSGAVLKVEKTSGEFVGEYTTGLSGYATVVGLEPGFYTVTEIKSPQGYSLSASPKTVRMVAGQPATVTIENDQLRGIQILKVDGKTNMPLPGVSFKITKANGEFIGQYKTSENGLITIAGLEPGAYTITELSTIDGYILDPTPKTVTLEELNPTIVMVEMKNEPLAGLQIRKIDGSSNAPLAGVEFEVRTTAGALVGRYTTSDTGTIFIDGLEPGTYVVTELTTQEGYTIDAVPRNVIVESGEMTTEVFKNYKKPVLTIKKVDSETKQPLANAKFKLMDDAYREMGVITTGNEGIINITGLEEGIYYVQEISAPAGYVLDSTIRQVSLQWGKTTVLELSNVSKGSLRLQKICSVTGKPLYGAVFNLYDERNNLLGEYTTDNTGMIIFSSSLPAGKYVLKEVKAPSGFVLDSTPQTIYLKSGETTEITLKNVPESGKIRIVKVSSAYNDVTKDKKGDTLKGAIFEIYDERDNVVDRITTGDNGVAISKDLPLGKYAIKEITPPKHYMTDGEIIYVELKVANDLIKLKVENAPSEIDTTVQKRGNVEVLSGDLMRWDFYDIRNSSTVALDDFYWHDLIPTDGVRATSFTTGVWSERVTMTAYYRTNLTSTYRVLKGNLLSTTNHELSLSTSALGLKANEYVTDIKLSFGTVQPGFHETVRPTLTGYVLPNLIDGYSIVNRTDVGGRDDDEWTYSKDSWVTIVIGKHRGRLPQTGAGKKTSAL